MRSPSNLVGVVVATVSEIVISTDNNVISTDNYLQIKLAKKLDLQPALSASVFCPQEVISPDITSWGQKRSAHSRMG